MRPKWAGKKVGGKSSSVLVVVVGGSLLCRLFRHILKMCQHAMLRASCARSAAIGLDPSKGQLDDELFFWLASQCTHGRMWNGPNLCLGPKTHWVMAVRRWQYLSSRSDDDVICIGTTRGMRITTITNMISNISLSRLTSSCTLSVYFRGAGIYFYYDITCLRRQITIVGQNTILHQSASQRPIVR